MTISLDQLELLVPEPLPDPRADRVFVKHRRHMHRIYTHRITYVMAQRAYCRIYTLDGDYTISVSLAGLERQLPPCNLFRIHRSYLVNLLHVRLIGKRVVRVGDRELPLSHGRRAELLARLRTIE